MLLLKFGHLRFFSMHDLFVNLRFNPFPLLSTVEPERLPDRGICWACCVSVVV